MSPPCGSRLGHSGVGAGSRRTGVLSEHDLIRSGRRSSGSRYRRSGRSYRGSRSGGGSSWRRGFLCLAVGALGRLMGGVLVVSATTVPRGPVVLSGPSRAGVSPCSCAASSLEWKVPGVAGVAGVAGLFAAGAVWAPAMPEILNARPAMPPPARPTTRPMAARRFLL